jgi:AraC-like DNA-binding protein
MEGAVADAVERAVERVIATMRENLGDELTVDDMARVAMFSKFYFTRIFQRVTGVSPGRFLAALRLQQAKQLLVSTSLNVADICMRVGYNSVGTFSSRFTKSVGLSPTEYRRLGGVTRQALAAGTPVVGSGVVSGQVWTRPTNQPSLVFVGLFPSRIPEGRPARCAILDGPGPYLLDRVPEGVWYVLSQSIPADPAVAGAAGGLRSGAVPTSTTAAGPGLRPAAELDEQVSVATHGPIQVRPNTIIKTADLRLQPRRPLDPLVLDFQAYDD